MPQTFGSALYTTYAHRDVNDGSDMGSMAGAASAWAPPGFSAFDYSYGEGAMLPSVGYAGMGVTGTRVGGVGRLPSCYFNPSLRLPILAGVAANDENDGDDERDAVLDGDAMTRGDATVVVGGNDRPNDGVFDKDGSGGGGRCDEDGRVVDKSDDDNREDADDDEDACDDDELVRCSRDDVNNSNGSTGARTAIGVCGTGSGDVTGETREAKGDSNGVGDDTGDGNETGTETIGAAGELSDVTCVGVSLSLLVDQGELPCPATHVTLEPTSVLGAHTCSRALARHA
jgi:hypothetical protein